MKNPNPSRFRSGFTLIELLVVIAIIAVLAAAGFAGGNAAMNKARKVTAQASATAVASAVEQFYSEYSSLPNITTGTKGVATDEANGIALLRILAGQEDGNSPENDRKIKFLSLKEGKGKTKTAYSDGAFYTNGKIDGLRDPWGQPFYVVLDDDYDEKITVAIGHGISSVELNGRRVAAYSLGVRKPADTKENTLVKSW